ncbi:hypothetical protein, partial [Sanguibacter sp. 25GB23B1]|uniref:hypothetical protein n=1 Tax=Sanguibacter sp. 25GB23B1 TaxID=3156067 RepID=UPI0032AEAC42
DSRVLDERHDVSEDLIAVAGRPFSLTTTTRSVPRRRASTTAELSPSRPSGVARYPTTTVISPPTLGVARPSGRRPI